MGKESCYSIFELADILVKETTELLPKVKNEEELKINFEKLLEPIKNNLKIKSSVQYNRTILTGRPDAVHGGVIIEYEPPKSFSSKRKIEEAYNQLVEKYLPSESKKLKPSRLVGVGFDGEKIFFVKYRQDKWIKEPKEGAYPFNVESAKTFLIYLRGLSRLPLTAENLAQKFGSQSELAQRAVSAFINSLRHWSNERSQTFFDEWKRLFGIVYGEKFAGGYQEKEREAFLKLYKVDSETNFQELLFSLHTYFAFLMKLIAAEILSLRETSFSSSFSSHLVHIPNDDQLKRELEDIENGGIYARKGITNFLEGDFFCWYLSAFDSPELKDAIREIARGLSEFEPATSILDPDAMHDLLKKLYQHLVPKDIRHQLGEYYTPDWLAELLLDEVGYDGNTLKKLLDPACGSGTFLVLAIQRAIQHGREKEKIPDIEIAKRIITNIWGFDLNPLAVIAARTNYLFVLGDLVNEILDKGGKIEIPIYLCDSILTPTRTEKNLFSEFLEVSTSVGRFQIPAVWVKESYMLRQAAPLIEEMVKNRYSVDEAMMRLEKEGLVFSHNKEIVENFYQQILKLEKEKKNGIWARFLKNAFAPMIAGKFDFVVGNPPWIRWDYLSQEYRNATLKLWKDYGLFSLKGFQARLGGGKKDFSMLFVYASADYYLKDGAKLGFLITQEVFKSKGAGEGFRRFQLGEGKYLKVLKAHDLVSIQPFEGATNKTAAIILKKGEKTQYPVPYIVWTKKKGVGKIATDKLLGEVLPFLQRKKYFAKPIDLKFGAWQTQPIGAEKLANIEGKNYYKAILGANPNPYGVFWLEVKKVLSDGSIIIRNLAEKGKQKIPIFDKGVRIESGLVYPAIRGRDIQRWGIKPEIYMLVVQNPTTRRGYSEEFIKDKYSRTYGYLTKFKEILLQRPLYKKYYEQTKAPFYSQFNISKETFARYKVVWKRMTNDLIATVVSQLKTPFGYKTIIPLETTTFIPTDNESEAHYLCAIINSKPVRDFIKSFSSAGRGFGTPSVMEHVAIPKFDPENPLHQKLAEISKKCHALQAQIYQLEKDKKNNKKAKELKNKLAKLEKENDRLVKELFNKKED
jgi:methylase of polypeptide subunit release factors